MVEEHRKEISTVIQVEVRVEDRIDVGGPQSDCEEALEAARTRV